MFLHKKSKVGGGQWGRGTSMGICDRLWEKGAFGAENKT